MHVHFGLLYDSAKWNSAKWEDTNLTANALKNRWTWFSEMSAWTH